MALPNWSPGINVAAISDPQNADLIRDPASETAIAIDEVIDPKVTAALQNTSVSGPILAAVEERADTAVEEVMGTYFQPGTAPGLVTYPAGAEPGKGFGVRFAIDPALMPASTASFHGLPTTTGAGAISVRTPNGTGGTWGNSLTPGFQRPTAGTAIVMALVDVGDGDGISRTRIGGLADTGVQSSMGGIVAAKFAPNDIRFFRWIITSTGFYGLSRWEGTSLSVGVFTTLLVTNVKPKTGDLVDLSFARSDGLLSLKVNGAILGFAQVLAAVREAHVGAGYAGMWANGPLQAGAKLGGWQWIAEYDVGTVSRQLVSVGVDNRLPSTLRLTPTQKREATGPVFDIRDYGAKCDAVYLTDASMTTGQATVSSPSYTFTAADVGKRIAVMGAGPIVANGNDGVLIGTILNISGSSAVIDANASATVGNMRCVFGTPDDEAFFRAQNAAAAMPGGGTVYFPAGRTIASLPLPVKDYVSWAGDGRDRSWVHIIQDSAGSATAAGESDWLTCAGRSGANPLIGATFSDFGVNAEAHIHTGGYGSAVKPLNIYYVQRCSIERMNVWNTPATAIPFDHSYDMCVIRDNVILRPGRLAPSGVGPGGSGIGAGTKGTGATEPTLIANNVIIGTHSAAATGPGHNGIFTEAQTGADPDLGVPGYRIVNNVIIGMFYGISDTGSTGSIITGNDIIGCAVGVRVGKTTLPDAYPGLNPIVAHNLIRGCTGPGASDGTGVLIHTVPGTNVKDYVHAIVQGNQIIDNKSWGIVINGQGVPVTGLRIEGNQILRNGRSGVKLDSFGAFAGRINYFALMDNTIAGNGRAGVAGDQAGVLILASARLLGGRIQDNDIFDMAAVPTQLETISIAAGSVLTNVRRAGNTGDA